MIKKIEKGDGILFVMFEYYGVMSGVLKNVFDFLNSVYFVYKFVVFLVVLGGGKGGINVLNNFRIVICVLYVNVLFK